MDMKIKAINGYNATNSVSRSNNIKSDSPDKVNKSLKSDVITISEEGAFQAELNNEIKAIAQEINDNEDNAKINELREQIKNGSYQISTDDLVDSILNRF